VGSIAYTLGIESTMVAITHVGTEAAAAHRHRLFTLRRLAGSTAPTTVTVDYTVTAHNTPLQTLQAALEAAITDGTLTTLLQTNGYPAAAASGAPTVVDVSPTSAPTEVPHAITTAKAGLDELGLAGIIISLFGVAVFTCIHWRQLQSCVRRQRGDERVYASGHGHHDT
jgi:hypothetical protein